MEREKVWWTVATDCGTRRTLAVSRAKAIRNVRYRLVMDDRSYDRPRPRDFAEMRDIEVVGVEREDATGPQGAGSQVVPRGRLPGPKGRAPGAAGRFNPYGGMRR